MSSAVMEYVLKREEVQEISIPAESTILSACARGKDLVVYALADDEIPDTETYRFFIYGTGEPVDESEVDSDTTFLDSVNFEDKVEHVFYRKVEEDEVEDPEEVDPSEDGS